MKRLNLTRLVTLGSVDKTTNDRVNHPRPRAVCENITPLYTASSVKHLLPETILQFNKIKTYAK